MKRRDFLLLSEDSERVVDLSCEWLYLQFADAQASAHAPIPEQGALEQAPWWAGEPPLESARSSLDDLLQTLERRLDTVDVLRVHERDWLRDEALKVRVYSLLMEFQSRGGSVEFPGSDGSC